MIRRPPGWWVAGGIGLLLLALVVGRLMRPTPRPTGPDPVRVWQPLPHRVEIEVLNSGGVIGAGRAGMLLLRRAGLDVVYLGNADSAHRGRDRNQVLVRRNDTAGVGRIVEALGDAEVIHQVDSSRMVDVTVLLGRRFAVPKGH
ncbi:MAG: LytR C-terminal domain-containing protein [Gemmatimonadales bacterium]